MTAHVDVTCVSSGNEAPPRPLQTEQSRNGQNAKEHSLNIQLGAALKCGKEFLYIHAVSFPKYTSKIHKEPFPLVGFTHSDVGLKR